MYVHRRKFVRESFLVFRLRQRRQLVEEEEEEEEEEELFRGTREFTRLKQVSHMKNGK